MTPCRIGDGMDGLMDAWGFLADETMGATLRPTRGPDQIAALHQIFHHSIVCFDLCLPSLWNHVEQLRKIFLATSDLLFHA